MSDVAVIVLRVPTFKLVVERILPVGGSGGGVSVPSGTGVAHASGGAITSVGPVNAATELTGLDAVLAPAITTALGTATFGAGQVTSGVFDVARIPSITASKVSDFATQVGVLVAGAAILATQISSGVLDSARIPTIPIGSGTSGLLDLTARVTGVLPAANGGASTPTGTGFPHVTAGVRDGAARAVDLSSADVTGVLALASVPSLPIDTKTSGLLDLTSRVVGVLPAANGGASTPTGTGFPHVTAGVRDAAARAVNLASSADVTGVLATANQAAQSLAGDVTGTTAAASVVAVRGIAISATAPTGAGQVLTSTGTGAAAWATPSSSATYESLAAWLAGSSPLYAQADVTTASATGARSTLRAQNATGATSTGGAARVQSGAGTLASGAIELYAGATQIGSFNNAATDFLTMGGGGTFPNAGLVRVPWSNVTDYRIMTWTYGASGTTPYDLVSAQAAAACFGDLAIASKLLGNNVQIFAGTQGLVLNGANLIYTIGGPSEFRFITPTGNTFTINPEQRASDATVNTLKVLSGSAFATATTNKNGADLWIGGGTAGTGGAKGVVNFVNATTTTTAPAAGGGGALPATPTGYLSIKVDGTARQVPFY